MQVAHGLAPAVLLRRSIGSRAEWTTDVRTNVLTGLVVALALIPESIAFSIIAGVDPAVGLFASFSMAVVIAFAGGRPAMISAATGAMALVVAPLVRAHGVPYLVAATLLTGLIQVVFGVLGFGRLMRFIPRSVMVGFVDALAILVFKAQLTNIIGKSWKVYALTIAGLGLLYVIPKITTVVPAALIAVGMLTTVTVVAHLHVPAVGDMGALPHHLPGFGFPSIPWNLATLRTVLPYAAALAVVGLLESLMTAQLIDDLTDTPSDKDREARGQGFANLVTGLIGGMPAAG